MNFKFNPLSLEINGKSEQQNKLYVTLAFVGAMLVSNFAKAQNIDSGNPKAKGSGPTENTSLSDAAKRFAKEMYVIPQQEANERAMKAADGSRYGTGVQVKKDENRIKLTGQAAIDAVRMQQARDQAKFEKEEEERGALLVPASSSEFVDGSDTGEPDAVVDKLIADILNDDSPQHVSEGDLGLPDEKPKATHSGNTHIEAQQSNN